MTEPNTANRFKRIKSEITEFRGKLKKNFEKKTQIELEYIQKKQVSIQNAHNLDNFQILYNN